MVRTLLFTRSLVFNILYWVGTFAFSAIYLPLLLCPTRRPLLIGAKIWAYCMLALARIVCGIRWQVEGRENIPESGHAIICSRHESSWETVLFTILFKNPTFVLKQELSKIPLFGLHIVKLYIPIDRSRSTQAATVIKKAVEELNGDTQVIIFPEGTRLKSGERVKIGRGYILIRDALTAPIVPVSLDSGKCWPRNSFLKHSGIISVIIQPPISAGTDRDETHNLVEAGIHRFVPKH